MDKLRIIHNIDTLYSALNKCIPPHKSSSDKGKYQEALALDLGVKPGQSNWAFAQFNNAFGRVLDINQQQFEQKINSAFGKLNPFPYVLVIVLLLIIGASIMGVKPRLDEYRF